MIRLFLRSVFLLCLLVTARLHAQEMPYFVTYTHHMEEPGSLEVETKSTTGEPRGGELFSGNSTEFEYGTRAWWTSELYLDWQSTAQQSTFFTGFRVENRARPLMREHAINPVFYVEFEDTNGADKSILEVVGHDVRDDLAVANHVARGQIQRELELKLILSSEVRGWNLSENIITEKDLAHAPWEFGYAIGASRPLRLAASARECRFCGENLRLGAEMYGGLGDVRSLGTHDTSHYLAPTANWSVAPGTTFSFSPGFGLNDTSLDHIFRFGVQHEFGQVGQLFRGRR